MDEIALAVFGTAGGVNGSINPSSFSLPADGRLHIVVDTQLPFPPNVEVWRFHRLRQERATDTVVLLALYTKIDDFGGERNGAFAGAGIFVRNGQVDTEVAVIALREMLKNLISSATDGVRFTRRIEEVVKSGAIKAPLGIGALVASYQPLVSFGTQSNLLPDRSLFARQDTYVSDPRRFFSLGFGSLAIIAKDIYFCDDELFQRETVAEYGVTLVTSERVSQLAKQVIPRQVTALQQRFDLEKRELQRKIEEGAAELSTFDQRIRSAVRDATEVIERDRDRLQKQLDGVADRIKEAVREADTRAKGTIDSLRSQLSTAKSSQPQRIPHGQVLISMDKLRVLESLQKQYVRGDLVLAEHRGGPSKGIDESSVAESGGEGAGVHAWPPQVRALLIAALAVAALVAVLGMLWFVFGGEPVSSLEQGLLESRVKTEKMRDAMQSRLTQIMETKDKVVAGRLFDEMNRDYQTVVDATRFTEQHQRELPEVRRVDEIKKLQDIIQTVKANRDTAQVVLEDARRNLERFASPSPPPEKTLTSSSASKLPYTREMVNAVSEGQSRKVELSTDPTTLTEDAIVNAVVMVCPVIGQYSVDTYYDAIAGWNPVRDSLARSSYVVRARGTKLVAYQRVASNFVFFVKLPPDCNK